MEIRKQFLIITPMSEPLHKLKEVLDSISAEENIEISLIDDIREINQFLNSFGQCLIAFSYAKKCATFLQENRFLIARTHSKVVLLTPKEIPSKTLLKFTKIGLTESIAETLPPKTLLYKIKFLIRSIKSTSGYDEKDMALKSIDTGPKDSQVRNEGFGEKHLSDDSTNFEDSEERTIFKLQDNETIEDQDLHENLKRLNAHQDDVIETHWKTKRKTDEFSLELEQADHSELEKEALGEIDKYYRGKKNIEEINVSLEEEDKLQQLQEYLEQLEKQEAALESQSRELALAASEESSETKKEEFEEENFIELKTQKNSVELFPESDESPSSSLEESEEERKRKELEELNSLIEEAKKRQERNLVEDLGGYYKEKSKPKIDLKTESGSHEKEVYSASERDHESNKSEKGLDINEEIKKRQFIQEYEEELRKRKQENERESLSLDLGEKLTNEDSKTDRIETMMKSETTLDRSKNIKTVEIQEREQTPDVEIDLEEKNRETSLNKNQKESEGYTKRNRSNQLEDIEKDLPLELTPAKESSEDIDSKNELDQLDLYSDKEHAEKKDIKLLDDSASADKKNQLEEEDDFFERRKVKSTDIEFENKKEKGTSGFTEKIDSFYRGGDAKKNDYDWDLFEKRNLLDLGLVKKNQGADEIIGKGQHKDLGEEVIDYRRLKEEFEELRIANKIDNDQVELKMRESKSKEDEDEENNKVVELDPAGFDFAIKIINMIEQGNIKSEDFFSTISLELHSTYQACPIFFNYKASDKKHLEVFNSLNKINSINESEKLWWEEYKNNESQWIDVQSKTMPTWICREIQWEDVELPAWAKNELTNKKVEYIYPFYDGLDRMGLAIIYFPNGINPSQAKGIDITIEMTRTLLLDTIQRVSSRSVSNENLNKESGTPPKKNIFSIFSGLFSGKKAG